MAITPGPWETLTTGNAPIIIQAKPPNQPHGYWHIATIATQGDENEANARAIAALPSLISALQSLLVRQDGLVLIPGLCSEAIKLMWGEDILQARAALKAAGVSGPTSTDTPTP